MVKKHVVIAKISEITHISDLYCAAMFYNGFLILTIRSLVDKESYFAVLL